MNGSPEMHLCLSLLRRVVEHQNHLKLISDARKLRLEGLEKERACTAYEWLFNDPNDCALYRRPPYPGRILIFSERCTRKILQAS